MTVQPIEGLALGPSRLKGWCAGRRFMSHRSRSLSCRLGVPVGGRGRAREPRPYGVIVQPIEGLALGPSRLKGWCAGRRFMSHRSRSLSCRLGVPVGGRGRAREPRPYGVIVQPVEGLALGPSRLKGWCDVRTLQLSIRLAKGAGAGTAPLRGVRAAD